MLGQFLAADENMVEFRSMRPMSEALQKSDALLTAANESNSLRGCYVGEHRLGAFCPL